MCFVANKKSIGERSQTTVCAMFKFVHGFSGAVLFSPLTGALCAQQIESAHCFWDKASPLAS